MNSQTDIQAETTVVAPRTVGPGAQLRQARLDLKLAPEDVAHILHLSPRQIVALETDDYDDLAGPTYVRGYLRGYAQLLGLPAEPVVEAYNRLVSANKPVDLGKLMPKAEIRSDHQLIKFATVAVIAIVLGLSAVWWREQERPAAPAPTRELPNRTTTDEAAVAGEAPAPMTNMGEPSFTSVVPTVPTADVARGAMPAKAPVVAPGPAPSVVTTNPNNLTAAVAPIVPQTSQSAPTGPHARLILQAQSESWADVRDGHGNRLLYETIPAGRTVAIEGVTPLSVFLGNVDGVRVQFNGQPYDVSRHKRGEVARFTLGETAGAR